MSNLWGMWRQTVSSKRLGQPLPCGLASCSQHGLCLGLALLPACGFPQEMFHISDISNFLGLNCSFSIHFHSFTHCLLRVCLQGFWLCHILPGLPGLSLKTRWKPSWFHYFCILHACKTNFMWTIPRSAAWGTVSRPPWIMALVDSQFLGSWEWWNESWGKGFLEALWEPGAQNLSLLKVNLSNEFTFFILESVRAGFWLIPKLPFRPLSYCPSVKSVTSF